MDIIINTQKKSIGIWGYGTVGKSAITYFLSQGYQVGLMEKRLLSKNEMQNIQAHNITLYPEEEKELFFAHHAFIFSSPGIVIKDYHVQHEKKWLNELDTFYTSFNKPIIAITGSVGKTSTTHLVSSLLTLAKKNHVVGGNIGIPMLSLIDQNKSVDYAVLEVSSFQLQYCSQFAPDIAIITNIYPNHLDHHTDYQEYIHAKYTIIKHQRTDQQALIHWDLRSYCSDITHNKNISYYTDSKPHEQDLRNFTHHERVYYAQNNTVFCYHNGHHHLIITMNENVRTLSFTPNRVLVTALSDMLKYDNTLINQLPSITRIPEHRLEKVATINTIDFYNDSKSTTIQTTLAAVTHLSEKPIHLFLGGLSKGVDRAPLLGQLPENVAHVYCFGQEALTLYNFCIQHQRSASHYSTLSDAFAACMLSVKHNEIVLLSPSGSSYDLYKNYEERGAHFKQLTNEYITTHVL